MNYEIDYPFIDGVEWQSAMLKLGNEKLLKDSMNGFVLTAPSDMVTLKAMYENVLKSGSDDEYSAFRVKVHSMKSNVATFGAYHVAGLAKYLEYAARDKESSVIIGLMPVFEREWNILRNAIISEFHMDDNDAASEAIVKEDLFVLLDKLESAMNEYDIDQADSVVEKLSSYSYSCDEKELLNQVKLHVANLDTEDCNEVIAKWKQIYSK